MIFKDPTILDDGRYSHVWTVNSQKDQIGNVSEIHYFETIKYCSKHGNILKVRIDGYEFEEINILDYKIILDITDEDNFSGSVDFVENIILSMNLSRYDILIITDARGDELGSSIMLFKDPEIATMVVLGR